MHAILITGGTSQAREKELSQTLTGWRVSEFDVVTPEAGPARTAVGIDSVRLLPRAVAVKPFGQISVVVFHQLDLLTVEAQNALLKFLEEPPPHVRVLAIAENINQLLPTVVSRFQVKRLPAPDSDLEKETVTDLATMTKILSASIGQRLALIDEKVASREDAVAFVAQTIRAGRALMLSAIGQPKIQSEVITLRGITKLARRLLLAEKQLAANVTYKLVIDHIFL